MDSDVITTNDNFTTENPTTANVTGEITTASAPLSLWGGAWGEVKNDGRGGVCGQSNLIFT
jgi:hypothetical protein